MTARPFTVISRETRPDLYELFAERLQHDDEQAQAHGWSKIAAFGFAGFAAWGWRRRKR